MRANWARRMRAGFPARLDLGRAEFSAKIAARPMRAQSTSLGALKFVFLLPFSVCQGIAWDWKHTRGCGWGWGGVWM